MLFFSLWLFVPFPPPFIRQSSCLFLFFFVDNTDARQRAKMQCSRRGLHVYVFCVGTLARQTPGSGTILSGRKCAPKGKCDARRGYEARRKTLSVWRRRRPSRLIPTLVCATSPPIMALSDSARHNAKPFNWYALFVIWPHCTSIHKCLVVQVSVHSFCFCFFLWPAQLIALKSDNNFLSCSLSFGRVTVICSLPWAPSPPLLPSLFWSTWRCIWHAHSFVRWCVIRFATKPYPPFSLANKQSKFIAWIKKWDGMQVFDLRQELYECQSEI